MTFPQGLFHDCWTLKGQRKRHLSTLYSRGLKPRSLQGPNYLFTLRMMCESAKSVTNPWPGFVNSVVQQQSVYAFIVWQLCMHPKNIYCFSLCTYREQVSERQRLKAGKKNTDAWIEKETVPRLLNGQLLKVERGTRSSQADCTQRVKTLTLLVGLLIVETFSFLRWPASSQASKQAARPAVV